MTDDSRLAGSAVSEAQVQRHMSDAACLEPDEDGFFTARCECGFVFGPLPGVEEVVDVLMEHAAAVASDSGWEINGEPWTWQQMYDREYQGRLKAEDKAVILSDLTRCEHGRHEGDDCSGCGGPSHGNPCLREDRLIGFALGATSVYYVPTVAEHRSDPEHNDVIKVAPEKWSA